ncbi:MAG: molybdenum cofactor biosynthesis protein B [Planctomycetota bacterium]
MSDSSQHHGRDVASVRCAAITISDTRTEHNDRGGQLLWELVTAAGHTVAHREIVKDEPTVIRSLVRRLCCDPCIDACLLTGGTGISARDQTCETISAMLTKPLPGYGELFRMLSYEEIGAAAMLSRAVGGVVDRTIVLTMPGSPAAVRLAMERLVLPQLGHLMHEVTK